MSERVTVLGRGRLGTALARWLTQIDLPVQLLPAPRTLSSVADYSEASLVILACPDAEISAVAARVAGCLGCDSALVHCSGVSSIRLLDAAAGYPVGAWHPLASVRATSSVPSWWSVTAPPALSERLRVITHQWGAELVDVPDDQRPGYHAASVFATNYVQSLLGIAEELLTTAHFSPAQARQAVGSLASSAVAGYVEEGGPAALTGPIRRGDATTVAAHVAALPTSWRRLYLDLATSTLNCVPREEQHDGHRQIRTVISEASRS